MSKIADINLAISDLEGKQSELLKKRKRIIKNLDDLSKEGEEFGFSLLLMKE